MLIKTADDRQPDIDALGVLLERSNLDSDTRRRIEREIKLVRAGIAGERDAAYEIDFHYAPRPGWAGGDRGATLDPPRIGWADAHRRAPGQIHGPRIHLPRCTVDLPDRGLLARRYEAFRQALT